jgi:hypothetical protein
VLTADVHFDELSKYFKSINADLPLKLIQQIQKDGEQQKDSDELCKAIYKSKDTKTKKKFFQLAHHTFLLTSYLSKNYPSYLTHNISKVEVLINKGEVDKANFIAENLLDIAEKTEDFQTTVSVLKFLAQQAHIIENKPASIKYHNRIKEVLHHETELNEIYRCLREDLSYKGKNSNTKNELQTFSEKFTSFEKSSAISVQLLAKYANCYLLSFYNDESFYSSKTFDKINFLINELERYSYLVFPFSDDIVLNVEYLKLKHFINTASKEELHKEVKNIIKHREPLRFWKNYINFSEIFLLSVEAGIFLNTYFYGYRKNFRADLPDDVKQEVEFCKNKCESILAAPLWQKGLHVRYININNIYCCFLLLGDETDIRKCIKTINSLLVNYQQISFHRLYDALFGTLSLAHLFLHEYDEVAKSFKRYEKLTKDVNSHPENDLSIRAIYFASQWVATERKQYAEKLNAILAQTQKEKAVLSKVTALILDLKSYFKIPD